MDLLVRVARGCRHRVRQTTLNVVFCGACYFVVLRVFNKLVSELSVFGILEITSMKFEVEFFVGKNNCSL